MTEEGTAPVEAPGDDAPTSTGPAPAGAGRHAGQRSRRGGRKQRPFWQELPFLVVVAVGLAFVIKTFLVQAFYIPSGSMENTLKVGDRVLVNKLVYDFRDPHRGEIIVFDGSKACTGNAIGPEAGKPCTWGSVQPEDPIPATALGRALRKVQGWIGFGSGGDHDFIKRVIAIGGDTVACPPEASDPNRCDKVTVNGVALNETGYVFEDDHQPFGPISVPKGTLWVMGDHRGNSSDSRVNGGVSVNAVVGKAFVTVWPLGRIGGHTVPGDFKQKFPQQK